MQNLPPPPPLALLPAHAITYRPLSSTAFNLNDNILEPTEVRGDIESHVCQLHNEILSQCLDNTGTYSCKEYSPRCYIIQKVTIILGVMISKNK